MKSFYFLALLLLVSVAFSAAKKAPVLKCGENELRYCAGCERTCSTARGPWKCDAPNPYVRLPIYHVCPPTHGSLSPLTRTRRPSVLQAYDFWTAETNCQYTGSGGHLASVHNKFDNELLAKLTYTTYWLGGTDQNANQTWTWTDNSDFGYSYWAAGQARPGQYDNCLIAEGGSGLWIAADCMAGAYYICEYEAANVTFV
ncbi:hypothetical protein QR680_014625 [Steinernema hermaphroditum]|uniref:C-type lectin domain-containing protein n=1 Tax=Steinernema hermaphroditum TaxID=289476 RepID=A0AA39M3J5_9BILA|nr:hypothetical protein QR680_014625 [Steinernema hermaphroditum]